MYIDWRDSMAFKISKVKERFSFDSLAVAKIVNYPFEKRDYKPFAQARVCLTPTRFVVRMWAFEATPVADITAAVPEMMKEDSFICFQIGCPKRYLSVSANANGVLYPELVCGGEKTLLDASVFETSAFTGEDLQGEYWGMQFSCEISALNELLRFDILENELKGNIYKACFNERAEHIGALFDVKSKSVYDPEAFGEYVITNY